MKLTITILFIFLAAVSCKKDIYSGITFTAPVFPDSVVVKTEVVNDTLYTKTAWGLASYRNYLILLANMDDCLFQVYDKTTGDRVRSFGQLGRGPQEILPVSSFYINDEKGILTSFNQSTKDVLVFHLDSIFSGKEHVMDKLNLSRYPGMTFLEALPARNHFLLYGAKCKVYPEGARYTLFAEDGKYISTYDDYPLSDKLLLNVCADEKVGKIYALAQTPLKGFILISFNI